MTDKKIFIDITCFYNIDFMSGIQRVVCEVTTRLLKMPDLNVVLFTWKKEDVELTVLNNSDYLACYDEGKLKKSNIKKDQTLTLDGMKAGDILFELDSVWDGRCHSRKELLPILAQKGVLISTYIYDIIAITNPEFFKFSAPDFYAYIAANLLHADLLITEVHATVTRLNDLAKRYNLPVPHCSVSWLGSDFKATKKSETVSNKARKIVKKGKYILCVGTLEPRKNHKLVLDAYDEKLSKMGVNLVFAGRRGWLVDDLLSRIDAHPKKNKGFYFLEGENDATIEYLYKNAYVVVFPTFDEGFGLPLVEALLHGAACAVSDVPVMREVGGTGCDYFDPKSTNSLLKLLSGYLEDAEPYEDCKKRASGYKPVLWDEVVEKIKRDLLLMKKDAERENLMKKYSTEKILKEICDDIKAKGVKIDDLQFSDVKRICNRGCLKTAIFNAQSSTYVDMYGNISGGKCKKIFKKLIRKFVRPAFMSQAKRQTLFNENSSKAIEYLERYVSELEARITKLEELNKIRL